MTHQEYLEKYGEDGYTRFLDRNDAANPERLDEQVALGRLAAFAPPQGDRRTSEALFWCPHIEKYPWWTATIRWAEDPTPKLP
ncbi:hypothetical protein, partial [Calidithermus roseus]|uniref:hypothetical protein n=1 Tax=Calidithermus roseus TaxID=1644118 RepID=UPI0011C3705A